MRPTRKQSPLKANESKFCEMATQTIVTQSIRSFLTISISLHLHFRNLKHHSVTSLKLKMRASTTTRFAWPSHGIWTQNSVKLFPCRSHVILTHYVKGARNLVLVFVVISRISVRSGWRLWSPFRKPIALPLSRGPTGSPPGRSLPAPLRTPRAGCGS